MNSISCSREKKKSKKKKKGDGPEESKYQSLEKSAIGYRSTIKWVCNIKKLSNGYSKNSQYSTLK